MRLKRYVFCLCMIAFWLSSCSRGGDHLYAPSLMALEDSADVLSERSLKVILDMDTSGFAEADRAFYHYLRVRARAVVSGAADSLLNGSDWALAFFERKKDSARVCRLNYYLGQVYESNYALLRANNCYVQGERFVGNDQRMLFKLKLGEASIYRFKMMRREEESCLRNALALARQLNDSSLLARSRQELSELYLSEGDYLRAGDQLRRALSTLPEGKEEERAACETDFARVFLAMDVLDSAYFYINEASRWEVSRELAINRGIVRGTILSRMGRFAEAERVLLSGVENFPLRNKRDVFYQMSLLKRQEGDFRAAADFANRSIRCRDSIDMSGKVDYITNLNAFQEHERQRKRIERMDRDLMRRKVAYYRLTIVFFLLLSTGAAVVYRIRRSKMRVEEALRRKGAEALLLQNKQEATQVLYMREKMEREALSKDSELRQIAYYKRLNELTIPVLMRSRNSQGAIHFSDAEWDIIIQNTNACFSGFTDRLREMFPQLSEDEIRFACLLKMEFSISLLTEIYHIAKGSVSRKKIRLKEKMQLDTGSLDDFIRDF